MEHLSTKAILLSSHPLLKHSLTRLVRSDLKIFGVFTVQLLKILQSYESQIWKLMVLRIEKQFSATSFYQVLQTRRKRNFKKWLEIMTLGPHRSSQVYQSLYLMAILLNNIPEESFIPCHISSKLWDILSFDTELN